MINIIGDLIEYNGERVAVMRQDVTPTTRAAFERALSEVDEPCECDEDENDDTEDGEDDTVTRLTTELESAQSELRALRALLGIKQ